MYVILIVAFWKRWNPIRIPAVVLSGALASNVITYVGAEFIGDHVARPLLFIAVNAPYFIVAAALAWRMRQVPWPER
jgi:hypothetical protein